MRWLPTLLFIYCIGALAVTAWVGKLQIAAVSSARLQYDLSSEDLDHKTSLANELKGSWLDLDNNQRAGRAEFDGPSAVDSSYETQMALEQYLAAVEQAEQAELNVADWEAKKKTAEKNLIPLIIGGIIHLIGLLALWPRRDSRRPALRNPPKT